MRFMARPFRTVVSASFVAALFFSALALVVAAPAAAFAQASEGSSSGGGGLAVVLGVLLALVLVLVAVRAMTGKAHPLPEPQARAWMDTSVTSVRFALEREASAFVARELGRIPGAAGGEGRGRLVSLQRVIRLLRKCDAAWTHGGLSTVRATNPPVGEGAYRSAVAEASAEPAETVHGPEGRALVTLIVAGRYDVPAQQPITRASLHALLDAIERLSERDLVAFEVHVSPDDSRAGIASAAIEARGAQPLGTSYGAQAMRCELCGGPFWSVLPTCPHCGVAAPADAA